MIWLKLAWRNSLRNRRRFVITAASVAVGTIALLMATGYMRAVFEGVKEGTIRGGVGHLQVADLGEFEHHAEIPLQFGLAPAQTATIEQRLESIEDIHFTFPRLSFEGLITAGDQTVIFTGHGVDPKWERRLSRNYAPIIEGDGLDEVDIDHPFQILLASGLARLVNAGPGDVVTLLSVMTDGGLNAADFDVVGIIETGIPELDRRYLMIPLPAAQELLQTDKISRLIVVLKDTERSVIVQQALAALEDDLTVRNWMELEPLYQQLVKLYQNEFWVFGLVIVIVVILAVANTVVMSVMERVPEIGMMRALGIPMRIIRNGFAYEGTIIGITGSLIGIVAAIALGLLINQLSIFTPPPPGRSISYPLYFMIHYKAVGGVFIVMVAVCIFSTWLPGRRVARMRIVEAIKHI
jgi:putative ABC transport system permease protein